MRCVQAGTARTRVSMRTRFFSCTGRCPFFNAVWKHLATENKKPKRPANVWHVHFALGVIFSLLNVSKLTHQLKINSIACKSIYSFWNSLHVFWNRPIFYAFWNSYYCMFSDIEVVLLKFILRNSLLSEIYFAFSEMKVVILKFISCFLVDISFFWSSTYVFWKRVYTT